MHTELATVPDFTLPLHSRQPGDCKRSLTNPEASRMQRSEDLKRLLETRIASYRDSARRPQMLSVWFYVLSLLPMLSLASIALIHPQVIKELSLAAVLAFCGLVLTITVWQFGAHYSRLAESNHQRARQLEDLLIYAAAIPEELWPAKEFLKLVLAGRQQGVTVLPSVSFDDDAAKESQ